MSAPPTSRAHARPPCRALDSSARCHCKPPSARCRRAVPWPTPAASAASCPSCCRRLSAVLSHAHPASLSPVLVAAVAALVRRPPCLPADPSPSSLVAPSHKNAACGHFLLHERLELLLTCAPGGTQEVRQRRNSLDCKCTALAEGRFQQVSGQWNFSKRPVEGRFQQVASGRSFCGDRPCQRITGRL